MSEELAAVNSEVSLNCKVSTYNTTITDHQSMYLCIKAMLLRGGESRTLVCTV